MTAEMHASTTTDPIIGLLGRKRSDKDSVANTLVAEHGFARFAFADALKQMLLDIDPCVSTGLRLSRLVAEDGWETAKENPEVRRLLQDTGMAVRRLNPGFWVDALVRQVDELRAGAVGPAPVVVSDVRFADEAAALENMGARLVRVVRPTLPVDTSAAGTHVSETGLDSHPVDHEIVNDGSLADLANKVRNVAAINDERAGARP